MPVAGPLSLRLRHPSQPRTGLKSLPPDVADFIDRLKKSAGFERPGAMPLARWPDGGALPWDG